MKIQKRIGDTININLISYVFNYTSKIVYITNTGLITDNYYFDANNKMVDKNNNSIRYYVVPKCQLVIKSIIDLGDMVYIID